MTRVSPCITPISEVSACYLRTAFVFFIRWLCAATVDSGRKKTLSLYVTHSALCRMSVKEHITFADEKM